MANDLFMRYFRMIAEPRVTRLLHFGVYIFIMIAGVSVFYSPPTAFEYVIGTSATYLMGSLLVVGSLLGTIAVLPGIWVMERAGLVGMGAGVMMYLIIVVGLGSSIVGLAVSASFFLTFVIRFLDIRGAQLAPREE